MSEVTWEEMQAKRVKSLQTQLALCEQELRDKREEILEAIRQFCSRPTPSHEDIDWAAVVADFLGVDVALVRKEPDTLP
jgi:hypothetical protein